MSLMNILIRRDRAHVLVDSAAYNLVEQKGFEASKLLLFPLENVILCSRGELIFTRWLYFQLLNVMSALDYDHIAGQLKGVAHELLPKYLEYYSAAGMDPEHIQRQEVCLVGWSARAGAPQGVRLTRTGATFTVEIMGGHIAPTLPAGLPDQASSTDEQWLCQIARHQIAHVKATASDTPIGGTLLLATLTKNQTELQRIPR